MIRNKFFEDPESGYTKLGTKNNFNVTWKMVCDYEGKTGLSLDNGFTKEQYVDLFNTMRVRRSRRFFNLKSHVMLYVRYLIANGVLPAEQEDILASITVEDLTVNEEGGQFFKNLNALHDAIEDSLNYTECYDTSRYDVGTSTLYLAWFGLTEEEIIDYPRKDVLDNGLMIHGEKVNAPYSVMQVLTRLRDADGYYQQARGVIFRRYVDSPYLIRTEHNAQTTLSRMRRIVSSLNALVEGKYALRYGVAYWSGIFYRAYCLECESTRFDLDDTAFASKVFCEDLTGTSIADKARYLSRVRDYNLYKQLFYPGAK